MKKVFVSIVCMLIGFAVTAQEEVDWNKKEYAREIVKALTSEEMHGRGYVNGGDGLAAGYIEKNFRLNHLKSFTRNYEQPFNFSVNTFPGKIAFRLNGKDRNTKKEIVLESKPGVDMLVGAGSPS
ncbi:MAG TPA: hypothetical protein VFF27_05325, partial [Bacteroidia bacterium]|nr:hypothetical protein [Bacteroidia bacterium]